MLWTDWVKLVAFVLLLIDALLTWRRHAGIHRVERGEIVLGRDPLWIVKQLTLAGIACAAGALAVHGPFTWIAIEEPDVARGAVAGWAAAVCGAAMYILNGADNKRILMTEGAICVEENRRVLQRAAFEEVSHVDLTLRLESTDFPPRAVDLVLKGPEDELETRVPLGAYAWDTETLSMLAEAVDPDLEFHDPDSHPARIDRFIGEGRFLARFGIALFVISALGVLLFA